MDPLRLVARALFAYVLLLVLIRLTGKRTMKHGSTLDFTIALVVGDLVDDMIWGEVPVAQFVVAAVVLLAVHVALDVLRFNNAQRSTRKSQMNRDVSLEP